MKKLIAAIIAAIFLGLAVSAAYVAQPPLPVINEGENVAQPPLPVINDAEFNG